LFREDLNNALFKNGTFCVNFNLLSPLQTFQDETGRIEKQSANEASLELKKQSKTQRKKFKKLKFIKLKLKRHVLFGESFSSNCNAA
jgi:hypothetical protein